MITVNNKQYRNLEEQVQKNKTDIENLIASGGVLDEFGIKVVGELKSIDDLPTPDDYKTLNAEWEYGDAFAVGTKAPYQLFILTRAGGDYEADHWLNIGEFPAVGPQGPQGIQGATGPQGTRGSVWVSSSAQPSVIGLNTNDQWLNTTNGDVYQLYGGNQWVKMGNIRGPQGVEGNVGQQGETGPRGPVGPQGPKGDAGQSFQIAGMVANTDLLPSPTDIPSSYAYAVGTEATGYDMYVIVPNSGGTLVWVNMGRIAGVEGPQGPAGPQGEPGLGATVITHSSSSSVAGQLLPAQVEAIQANPGNTVLLVNSEMYYPADIPVGKGFWVYSHLGFAENNTYSKALILNYSTGVYDIVVSKVGGLTEQDVRDLINEAIGDALTGDY